MSTEDQILQRLFTNFKVSKTSDGGAICPLPLTDFAPRPLTYPDVHHIARLMVEAVPPKTWEQTRVIVGMADRSAGSVIHVMSAMVGTPYTICNWYPKGPRPAGSIFVCDSDINGPGEMLLNGLEKGDTVVFADVVIRSGSVAEKLIAACRRSGVNVLHAVFGADYSDRDGLKNMKNICPSTSVGTIVVDDHGDLLETSQFKRNLLAARVETSRDVQDFLRANEVPAARPLQLLPRTVVESCFQRCLSLWTGFPVYSAEGSTYPYSAFPLTDFMPVVEPHSVDDTADAMCYLSPLLRKFSTNRATDAEKEEYLLVSESDRGGGPLVVAVARRTGLAFTMANWSSEVPLEDGNTAKSASEVGYSGSVQLFLNSIRAGQKCIVIDDMLSSGGTCEGLLKAIQRAKGVPVECVFASEKVTTKGRARLHKSFPKLPLTSVCFFDSGKSETVASHPDSEFGHETPIQSFAAAGKEGPGAARRERDGKQ